jgi:rhamnosyltransferase
MIDLPTAPTPAGVVAIVVTLSPDDGLADRIAALRDQVAGLVVVDNGSGPAADQILTRLAEDCGAEVVRNQTNRGIATALNQGIARAADLGARWVLTLDQDTLPLPGLVAEAMRTYEAFPERALLAVIAGRQHDHPVPVVMDQRTWEEVPALITAGSLVSLAAYRAVGPFREDFFVDYVDIEFCLRARRAGYHVVQGNAPTIEHSIGRPTRHRLLFRDVTSTNHSPARRYYITRNRIVVWKRHWSREPRYILADVVASVKELVKVVLFEDRRGAKLRSVARGTRDALADRSGPLEGPRQPV